ncbi:septum formation family protein [Pseudarthrobacter sp. PvP090]|uniref:septum formation family protein n=1 Tax=Pseudarthrobacter sp. PvP090 TaxID=3156393 RepID=UPI0033931476
MASDKGSQLGGWVRRQGAARTGAAVAAVAVMGLLIWLLTSLGGGPKQSAADVSPAPAATSAAPASRGPLPLEGVGPLDFRLGDCFKDFDPEAPQSTIVDCTTGHSAQLIAIHHYQASDAYPGLAALKDKGRETCRNAQVAAAAATTYNLLQRNAYPSSSSWDNGDRRVDCYVTADAGNVIMESLVP